MKFEDLTEHEKRILRYLDQRGPTHRETMVVDLASETSRIGSRTGPSGKRYVCGSNGATPMIAANWCKRLSAAGLVYRRNARDGFYRHHEITRAGQVLIRTSTDAKDTDHG